MAGGNIIRIVGGKSTIVTEEWIVYTDQFTAYAGKGSHFTADKGTFLGNPKAPPFGKYFLKGFWSADNEGNKKITKAKVGEKVYFQVEMTKKFPETELPVEKQNTINFELYQFDGNEYSIGYIYLFGPRILLEKEPKKVANQKVSYITWEDINKNKELDPEEEYTKKPYTSVKAVGKKAVIPFQLSEGLSNHFNEFAELKLFMSISYNGEIIDLPANESEYLDVEQKTT